MIAIMRRMAPAIDKTTMVALVHEHQGALFQRALSLSGHQSDAWDLVQDTFERALRMLSCDYPREQTRGWLLLTLRNLFIDRERARRRQRNFPLVDDLAAPETPSELDQAHWRRVEDEALERCLNRLDVRLREVYLLRAGGGRSLASIGQELGIPLATAGTRLHRARARLRTLLLSEVNPETEQLASPTP